MDVYASRAGEKLAFALKEFNINVKDLVCVDLGASTGGFTDCLLQNGAQKVFAVEKGYGTLDWKLRNDSRVQVLERTNALEVVLPEKVALVVIDIGWTKQRFIIPKALELLKDNGIIISLLKPHYEAERYELYKGKVREEDLPGIIERVVGSLPVKVEKVIESPIVGGKGGNKEFFLLIRK